MTSGPSSALPAGWSPGEGGMTGRGVRQGCSATLGTILRRWGRWSSRPNTDCFRRGGRVNALFSATDSAPTRYLNQMVTRERLVQERGLPVALALFQRVHIAVRAAEVDRAADDQRRREDRSDAELLDRRDDRCFAPARPEEERRIEFAVGGQDPACIPRVKRPSETPTPALRCRDREPPACR